MREARPGGIARHRDDAAIADTAIAEAERKIGIVQQAPLGRRKLFWRGSDLDQMAVFGTADRKRPELPRQTKKGHHHWRPFSLIQVIFRYDQIAAFTDSSR